MWYYNQTSLSIIRSDFNPELAASPRASTTRTIHGSALFTRSFQVILQNGAILRAPIWEATCHVWISPKLLGTHHPHRSKQEDSADISNASQYSRPRREQLRAFPCCRCLLLTSWPPACPSRPLCLGWACWKATFSQLGHVKALAKSPFLPLAQQQQKNASFLAATGSPYQAVPRAPPTFRRQPLSDWTIWMPCRMIDSQAPVNLEQAVLQASLAGNARGWSFITSRTEGV